MNLEIDRRVVFAATGGKEHGPNQPLIVFLHGAGMDHSVWALQSRWFAHHGGNVLAVDLPGHGRSAGPPLTDIASLADWTERLIAGICCDRASLVGHSMGADCGRDRGASSGPVREPLSHWRFRKNAGSSRPARRGEGQFA
jgi:pimeloyl-ACP methyl ester carboxylesterase